MTQKEYLDLFHKAQVNLVAFKPVFHCNEELRRMVEMAVEAEREACAKAADEWVRAYQHPSEVIAKTIRARGNT